MSTIVQTITTNILKRAWGDIEPKLWAWLATGVTATVVVKAAAYAGIAIDPAAALAVSTLVGLIAGYLKSSTERVAPVLPAVEVPAQPAIVTPAAPIVDAPAPEVVTIIPEPPVAAIVTPVSVPAVVPVVPTV
ncbi:hypothetical protein [Cryobacterium sp. GrIS_2_6]|uniref:hypothetical protein n=1 Tax=Cryobacterium sp. GrIS_2_6 TaxID=3162785 RepID=UPI002E012E1D|nr:hypothetical protein [Cryobacterium psychrotolerans]MEC5149211.1 hypothetical protein [Cryobacterium psychrotolerans]MEC5149292.1 hypothetical protein [Cryobacterium psychrotolerans]